MVRECPAGDPAQGTEAGGLMVMRGNWNSVWASFDQRRKAKANDGAEDDVPGAGEPDMFGDAAAAE